MNLWTILSPSNKAKFEKYYESTPSLGNDYREDLMNCEYTIHLKFETIIALKGMFGIKNDADVFKLFHIIPKRNEIEDVVVGGIDHADYPEYCDAHIESATWNGKELTEHQIELFTYKYPYKTREFIMADALEE